MSSVLIVDDQEGVRRSLEFVLRKEGYRVASAANGEQALQLVQEDPPDVVVTDLRMEPVSGIELLQRVKAQSPQTEVILMTAYATVDSAVTAMKLGAFDYITKPFKNPEITVKVRRALEKKMLLAEVQQLRREVSTRFGMHALVGNSAAMRAVLSQVAQIGPTALSVLITGETGTGKSLVARALHYNSPRASQHFVSVNCAALPEALLESELFGHEKGAFTGAVRTRKGLFEEAHQGTLFLDEIGAMTAPLQTKLLGALQDREVRRLGQNRSLPVDVRVITATNAELDRAVLCGEFRQDLFYRLNVARIHLPPLRERREDIPDLTRHILAERSAGMGKALTLSPDALELLCRYDYPGNVRELQNALEWAMAVAPGTLIAPRELPEAIRTPGAPRRAASGEAPQPVHPEPGARTLDQYERDAILEAIARHRGNLTQTAKALGIGRTTLWRRIREYEYKK